MQGMSSVSQQVLYMYGVQYWGTEACPADPVVSTHQLVQPGDWGMVEAVRATRWNHAGTIPSPSDNTAVKAAERATWIHFRKVPGPADNLV